MGSSKQRIHKKRGVKRLNPQGGVIGSNGVVSVDTNIQASNEPINLSIYTNNGNPAKELKLSMIDNIDNLSLSLEYFEWLKNLTELINIEVRKESPNIYLVEQFSAIASHIACVSDVRSTYDHISDQYRAVYG